MAQGAISALRQDGVMSHPQRFRDVTKQIPALPTLSVISSVGYVVLLTYVRGLIIDRFQADPAPPDQVFSVFKGYILALLIVYAVSQALSKLQDYSVYRLEINGNYKLARLCFDTLSNRSMKFHTSRFGRSLMSECTQLVDVVVYSLIPIVASVVATFVILGPAVPIYAVLLAIMLVIYLIVTTKMGSSLLMVGSISASP